MEREYRIIEPEVAGGLGVNSVLDYSTSPATVLKLHYEFEGWMGDELLTTTPCFIVTIPLKDALVGIKGTGYSFDELTVSKSAFFKTTDPKIVLPEFAWLKIFGHAGFDDAGLGKNSSLVVSNDFLAVLSCYNISNCIIRRRPYRQ